MTTDNDQSSPDAPIHPRDRWWFSPMLQVVAGGAVAAFQWGPVSQGSANWLNWLVAAAGVVVAGFGVVGWFKARPRAEG
jgi:hypothetical protein